MTRGGKKMFCFSFRDLSQTAGYAFCRLRASTHLNIEIYVAQSKKEINCYVNRGELFHVALSIRLFNTHFLDFSRCLLSSLCTAPFPIAKSLIFHFSPSTTSTESDAKNQFNSVTRTSTAFVYSRYQRSQQSDFESDNGFDGDELVQNPLDRGPYFDVAASRNVTALVGSTAYLNCRVRNFGQ